MRGTNAASRTAKRLMAWTQDGQREAKREDERGSFGGRIRRYPSVDYGIEQIV